MSDVKQCSKCLVAKNLESFHSKRSSPDLRSGVCKICENARRQRAYASKYPTPPMPPPPLSAPTGAIPEQRPPHPGATSPPEPTIDSTIEETRQARKLRVSVALQKDMVVEIEKLRAKLEALAPLTLSSPILVEPAPALEKGEAVPLILASDWHVEERVDATKMHGVNSYDLEIAQARSSKFFQNSLRLVDMLARDSLIRRVEIGLLGDLISGSIHPELMEINELGPSDAMTFAKDLIVGGIEYWLKNSDLTFTFNCVGGNHGRMTEKTRIATNAENSLESFAYRFLAAEFKKEPRVTFRVAAGDMLYSEVLPGFTVRWIHGDQIGYGGGVGGVTIPLNKWISRQDRAIRSDLTCLGHFHHLFDGGNFLLNGSLIGPSPYSQRFGLSPEPAAQQLALIHSEYKKTAVFKIVVT